MLDDTLTRLLAGVLGTVLAEVASRWVRAAVTKRTRVN